MADKKVKPKSRRERKERLFAMILSLFLIVMTLISILPQTVFATGPGAGNGGGDPATPPPTGTVQPTTVTNAAESSSTTPTTVSAAATPGVPIDLSFYKLTSVLANYANGAMAPTDLVEKESKDTKLYAAFPLLHSGGAGNSAHSLDGGVFLGYPGKEAGGFDVAQQVSNWWTSQVAAGSVSYSYQSLANVSSSSSEEEKAYGLTALISYARYGYLLNAMGIDRVGLNFSFPIQRVILGGLFFLMYSIGALVPLIFGVIINFLVAVNPFRLLTGAANFLNKTIPATPIATLGTYMAKIFDAVYEFSWAVTIPLFFTGIIISWFMLKTTANKNGRLGSKIKLYLIRLFFIVLGLPLLGGAYTSVLKELQISNVGSKIPANYVVASTFVDFKAWAANKRLAIPPSLSQTEAFMSSGDNSGGNLAGSPSGKSMSQLRSIALNINRFSGGLVTNSAMSTGLMDNDQWAAMLAQESENSQIFAGSQNDEKWNARTLQNLILRYMNGEFYQAADWETDVKAIMQVQAAEGKYTQDDVSRLYKFFKSSPDLLKLKVNDQIYILNGSYIPGNTKPSPINIFMNGGLTAKGGDLNQENVSGVYRMGGSVIFQNIDNGAVVNMNSYSPLDSGGLSIIALYNYLNTEFTATNINVFSTVESASMAIRKAHYSVNLVGRGVVSLLYGINGITILTVSVVLALAYAGKMLINSLKRAVLLIMNIPFGVLGSIRSIAKVVIYVTMLIMEVVATLILYTLASAMIMEVPRIFDNLMKNIIVGNIVAENGVPGDIFGGGFLQGIIKAMTQAMGDAAGTNILILQLILSTIAMILICRMMLKVRTAFVMSIDAAVASFVDRFLETSGASSAVQAEREKDKQGPGVMGSAARGLAQGAGFAMASKALLGKAGDDKDKDSDSLKGERKKVGAGEGEDTDPDEARENYEENLKSNRDNNGKPIRNKDGDRNYYKGDGTEARDFDDYAKDAMTSKFGEQNEDGTYGEDHAEANHENLYAALGQRELDNNGGFNENGLKADIDEYMNGNMPSGGSANSNSTSHVSSKNDKALSDAYDEEGSLSRTAAAATVAGTVAGATSADDETGGQNEPVGTGTGAEGSYGMSDAPSERGINRDTEYETDTTGSSSDNSTVSGSFSSGEAESSDGQGVNTDSTSARKKLTGTESGGTNTQPVTKKVSGTDGTQNTTPSKKKPMDKKPSSGTEPTATSKNGEVKKINTNNGPVKRRLVKGAGNAAVLAGSAAVAGAATGAKSPQPEVRKKSNVNTDTNTNAGTSKNPNVSEVTSAPSELKKDPKQVSVSENKQGRKKVSELGGNNTNNTNNTNNSPGKPNTTNNKQNLNTSRDTASQGTDTSGVNTMTDTDTTDSGNRRIDTVDTTSRAQTSYGMSDGGSADTGSYDTVTETSAGTQTINTGGYETPGGTSNPSTVDVSSPSVTREARQTGGGGTSGGGAGTSTVRKTRETQDTMSGETVTRETRQTQGGGSSGGGAGASTVRDAGQTQDVVSGETMTRETRQTGGGGSSGGGAGTSNVRETRDTSGGTNSTVTGTEPSTLRKSSGKPKTEKPYVSPYRKETNTGSVVVAPKAKQKTVVAGKDFGKAPSVQKKRTLGEHFTNDKGELSIGAGIRHTAENLYKEPERRKQRIKSDTQNLRDSGFSDSYAKQEAKVKNKSQVQKMTERLKDTVQRNRPDTRPDTRPDNRQDRMPWDRDTDYSNITGRTDNRERLSENRRREDVSDRSEQYESLMDHIIRRNRKNAETSRETENVTEFRDIPDQRADIDSEE